jgi:acyl-CoA oxidase
MLFIRVQIVASLGGSLLKGILIGARYAVVRRQFSTVEGSKIERKLMDYQTHQFKYIPLLAYAVAFTFAGHELTGIYARLQEELKSKNFGLLEMVHHLSTGFKSVGTQIVYEGLDAVRQSCGGAGFSAWSGLPQQVVDYAPNTTYEGDNTMLAQQCAKLVMKTLK